MADELTFILFALSREAMVFRRRVRGRRNLPGAPCAAWSGTHPAGEVVVLTTGMGAVATHRALEWVRIWSGAQGRCPRVISAGFCGALATRSRVGNTIRPSRIIEENGDAIVPDLPGTDGTLLSVSRPVMTAEHRRELHARFGAVAVDMESATAVRWSRDAGVPCACLRAVSDDSTSVLPQALARVLTGEQVRLGSLGWAVLRQPWLIVNLYRLARDSSHASRSLAEGLEGMLTASWSDGMRESGY